MEVRSEVSAVASASGRSACAHEVFRYLSVGMFAFRAVLSFLNSLLRWRQLIVVFAFHRLTARYRSSWIGPLWIALSFTIFAGGIAAMWSAFFDRPFSDFFPYVALGLFSWNLTGATIVESARSLQQSKTILLQSAVPTHIFPIISAVKNIFIVPQYILVCIPIYVIFVGEYDLRLLWLIPGFALLFIFMSATSVLLAYIGILLSDLGEILANVLRFVFFFTPIVWTTDMRPGMPPIWLFNPFYYVVELIRGPALGTSDPVFIFAVVGGGTFFIAAAAATLLLTVGDIVRLRLT